MAKKKESAPEEVFMGADPERMRIKNITDLIGDVYGLRTHEEFIEKIQPKVETPHPTVWVMLETTRLATMSGTLSFRRGQEIASPALILQLQQANAKMQPVR